MRVTDDQREIWLASLLAPEASAAYHLSDVIHIAGALDRSIPESSLQELVNRHDALRITIAGDGLTQDIAPQREQVFEVVALDDDLIRPSGLSGNSPPYWACLNPQRAAHHITSLDVCGLLVNHRERVIDSGGFQQSGSQAEA